MGHYQSASPKRHVGMTNNVWADKLNMGKLTKNVKEKCSLKTVRKTISKSGKVGYQGNSNLKGTQFDPYLFLNHLKAAWYVNPIIAPLYIYRVHLTTKSSGPIRNDLGLLFANWCRSWRPRARGWLTRFTSTPQHMSCCVTMKCLIGQRPTSKRWFATCTGTHPLNCQWNGNRLSPNTSNVLYMSFYIDGFSSLIDSEIDLLLKVTPQMVYHNVHSGNWNGVMFLSWEACGRQYGSGSIRPQQIKIE